MQLQTLNKAKLLQAGQQEVMQNTSYIPPRRNIAYSTLPHTNAHTIYLSDTTVGVIQDQPQSAGSGEPIDTGQSGALPVSFDVIPVPDETVTSNLTQRRATLSINNDTLTISNDEVTQNIYIGDNVVPNRD